MTKNSCFTTKIDIHLKDKLLNDLTDQGFEISHPAYTFFCAKKEGISLSFYTSGSLTVQGKNMQEFIEFYLEPEILHNFSYTHSDSSIDLTPRIGLDEAGKGDFFGPLCVAAVFADSETIKYLQQIKVQDSKNLSDPKILQLAEKIRDKCSYTVIRLFPEKYNELYKKFKNLNRLLGWAHVAALADISNKTNCKTAILDQFADKKLVDDMLKQKKINCNLIQRTKAEDDLVVAAASILARAGFVTGIDKLSQDYEMTLPKGASSHVIKAAEKLVAKFGFDILEKTAKTHFKTVNQIKSHAQES